MRSVATAIAARARTLALALVAAGALMASPGARAEEAASWRFAPAQAPSAPSGAAPAPYPVPLGSVGDISFWAPNRGLLITGGTESGEADAGEVGSGQRGPVAAGLYVYNGVEWHQLSTVCGGATGRIAWAGPDEFWTIADQREGQQVSGKIRSPESFNSISLCHFLDGEVVGSYAMPLQQSDSYVPMDAAACYGPSDCWFAGQYDDTGSEAGVFHLHWDGSTLSAVYEPGEHGVSDMVDFKNQIYQAVQPYESVQSGAASHPVILHTIGASSSTSELFGELPIFSDRNDPPVTPLPTKAITPGTLQGFSFGTDGLAQGEDATQLWAAATPREREGGPVTVLRYAEDAAHRYAWSQVIPNASGSPLAAWVTLAGAEADVGTDVPIEQGAGETVAPEPGSNDAWLSLHNEREHQAMVALLEPDGTLAKTEYLPGPDEAVGDRGEAGPIVCPAPHDCWMATNGQRDLVTGERTVPGWLFHYTDGSEYPRDTDSNYSHVITSRPPDSGVPVVYPNLPPLDDSLANQQPPPAPSRPPLEVAAPATHHRKGRALVKQVHTRLVDRRTLVLSFTLTVRAHVQLLARRHKTIVARTHLESLGSGRHRLSLVLSTSRWPTGFQLRVTPVGAHSPASTGSEEAGSGDTVST